MSTTLKKRVARQFYNAGRVLFNQGAYEQALAELQRAEDVFRKLDVRGQPFSSPLENGVSGLANTLFLEGMCCQKLGDYGKAVTCYESGLINSTFEKKKPFRAFLKTLHENMLACYERELGKTDAQTLDALLKHDPEIDASFRFPFSLARNAVPIARLYEFSPERYPHFKDFYTQARKKDLTIRGMNKSSDESSMKKTIYSIWGILAVICIAYSLMVINALMHKE